MLLGISSRSRNQGLAWELMKLLTAGETIQNELYTYSHGISPVRQVAEDREAMEALIGDIPNGSGFSPEVIRDIMTTAVSAPQFERYNQAMIMAESAVAESGSSQNQQSRMLTAQREINIFLNQ